MSVMSCVVIILASMCASIRGPKGRVGCGTTGVNERRSALTRKIQRFDLYRKWIGVDENSGFICCDDEVWTMNLHRV